MQDRAVRQTFVHRTSHWRVLWSAAGQGHVLFIETPLLGSTRIYADNPAVARFLQRAIEVLLYKPSADEALPIIDAKFERGGHSLSAVKERIVSARDTIILSWWNLMAPFVKLATNVLGSVGLEIEAVVLGEAAREEDVDARARSSRRSAAAGHTCCARSVSKRRTASGIAAARSA